MMQVPVPDLPSWLRGPHAARLAAAAHRWWQQLGNWAMWPVNQMDPRTCREGMLELIAWQRDIHRLKEEPLSLFRLRVHHAYENAKDAGSVAGFRAIMQRLGIGYVEVDERMPGRDWDVISIRISDTQIAGNQALMDTIIRQYGRTCRRYEWKTISRITVKVQVVEFSNDHLTEIAE